MLVVEAKDVDRKRIIRKKGSSRKYNSMKEVLSYGICKIQYRDRLSHDEEVPTDFYIRLGIVMCVGGLISRKHHSGENKMHLKVKLEGRQPSTEGILHAFKELRSSSVQHMTNVERERHILPLKKFHISNPEKSYEDEIWRSRNPTTGELFEDEDPYLHLPVNKETKFIDLRGKHVDSNLLMGNFKIFINPIIKVTHTFVSPSGIIRDKFVVDSAAIIRIQNMDTCILQREFAKKHAEENPQVASDLDKMLEELKLRKKDEQRTLDAEKEKKSRERKEWEQYNTVSQIDPRFAVSFPPTGYHPPSLPTSSIPSFASMIAYGSPLSTQSLMSGIPMYGAPTSSSQGTSIPTPTSIPTDK